LVGLGEDLFIFGNYCRSLIVRNQKKKMFTRTVTAKHRRRS